MISDDEYRCKKDSLSKYCVLRRQLLALSARAKMYEGIASGEVIDVNPFRQGKRRLTADKCERELSRLLPDMQEMLTHMLCARNEAQQKIEALEDSREEIVLYLRYFCDMRFEDIGETLGLCTYTISKIHRKAVEHC